MRTEENSANIHLPLPKPTRKHPKVSDFKLATFCKTISYFLSNLGMASHSQIPKASSFNSSNTPDFALCSTKPDRCDWHRCIISKETVTCMGCQKIFSDTWRMHQMPCGICFLCPSCLPKVAFQPSRRMAKSAVAESVKSLMGASKALRDQALDRSSRSIEQRRALMASANELELIARSEAGLTCKCGVSMHLTDNYLSCLQEKDAQQFWTVEQTMNRLAAK